MTLSDLRARPAHTLSNGTPAKNNNIIFELSYWTLWLSGKLFLCQIRNYCIGQPCQKKIQVWTGFFCCPVGQNLFVVTVTLHLQGVLCDQKNYHIFEAVDMCCAHVVCIGDVYFTLFEVEHRCLVLFSLQTQTQIWISAIKGKCAYIIMLNLQNHQPVHRKKRY